MFQIQHIAGPANCQPAQPQMSNSTLPDCDSEASKAFSTAAIKTRMDFQPCARLRIKGLQSKIDALPWILYIHQSIILKILVLRSRRLECPTHRLRGFIIFRNVCL